MKIIGYSSLPDSDNDHKEDCNSVKGWKRRPTAGPQTVTCVTKNMFGF